MRERNHDQLSRLRGVDRWHGLDLGATLVRRIIHSLITHASKDTDIMLKPTYENFVKLAATIQSDADILCGNACRGQGAWQDVAGTMATNLRVYAALLDHARESGSFPTFPDWSEVKS